MFIEGTIIGLVIGKIRKGKFSNLGYLSIRAWPLIILAFLLQMSPAFSEKLPLLNKLDPYVFLISLIVLVLVVIINIRKKGTWALLIGLILNLVVILLNQNKMPISFDGLNLAGMQPMVEGIKSGDIVNFISLEGVTNWTKYFSKYIVIPEPYPLSKVLSIGDVFLILGLILFLQGEMIQSRYNSRNRMIKFGYNGKI